MIEISQSVFGVLCLIGACALTFAWPLGARRGSHIVLSIVIWSIRRHRSPILQVQSDCGIDKLMPSLSGLTLSTSVEGNTVDVLENGALRRLTNNEIAKNLQYGDFSLDQSQLGVEAFYDRMGDLMSPAPNHHLPETFLPISR